MGSTTFLLTMVGQPLSLASRLSITLVTRDALAQGTSATAMGWQCTEASQMNVRYTFFLLSSCSGVQGVTKHRRSGRWEAHVWVREDGKQAYLGGYSTEEEAAEAHDVAALKCHGLKAKTNFHISR